MCVLKATSAAYGVNEPVISSYEVDLRKVGGEGVEYGLETVLGADEAREELAADRLLREPGADPVLRAAG